MKKAPSNTLIVQVNGSPILEYDRDKELSVAQHESLELMNEKLNQGITLGEHVITKPNLEQRVEFVAANLISALINEEEVLAAASCAYLATALPELKQIKALEKDGAVSIELIFDREYQKEMPMNYMRIEKVTTQH